MVSREGRFGLIQRLDDFRPLLPAEEDVVSSLSTGEYDRLNGGVRPEEPDDSLVIRATFLRFLLLGGDEECRPHEKGIRLSGAYISGVLDLEACRVPRDVGLKNCRFDSTPVFSSAVIERLFLDGSAIPGLHAERLQARGGLYLRGAEVNGEVRLVSSTFGGNVRCDGSVIRSAGQPSVNAEGIDARSLRMRGARCDGPLLLSAAELVGDLDCAGMTVKAGEWDFALDARSSDIGGSVILQGARIEGEASFVAARVAADLNCTDARVQHPGEFALQLSRATIGGAFLLLGKAEIDGALAMTGTTVGSIHDSVESWPARGDLLLNRCVYQAFITGPVDARSRLQWLALQSPERWGEDFWPQPYEQVAIVLQQLGHEEDARKVLIEKERRQRRARRERLRNPVLRVAYGVCDAILKVTVAYGRQPLFAFVWLIAVWLVGVAVFGIAESRGAFRPTAPVLLRQPEWMLCGLPETEQRMSAGAGAPLHGIAAPGETQLDCFRRQWEAASFPKFSPWMYSLDSLLPVLDLQQKDIWSPDPKTPLGAFTRIWFYIQSILGWTLSLLAVAGFSGLVKLR